MSRSAKEGQDEGGGRGGGRGGGGGGGEEENGKIKAGEMSGRKELRRN